MRSPSRIAQPTAIRPAQLNAKFTMSRQSRPDQVTQGHLRMDTFRGLLGDLTDAHDLGAPHRGPDDSGTPEVPASIGQDERRMQVRAYNHWAGLLADRNFPLIEDLDPQALPDFGPYSVILDFSAGVDNPAVQFLGEALAIECGTDSSIRTLHDVPSRSLLSRITDHYMQIIANQAPIGFEAEFVNQRGQTILYRGILLPFSSDDDTIDFIHGVINWKEIADQQTTDELMLEFDQVLDNPVESAGLSSNAPKSPVIRRGDELTVWADGPTSQDDDVLDLATLAGFGDDGSDADPRVWPTPHFGASLTTDPYPAADLELAAFAAEQTGPVEMAPENMGLADWLASARELAHAARSSEDRTRGALYGAIGRAWDFALAASEEPEEFQELIEDAGLTVQDRAPMTPVVKLVFGADYDKTRLTEYAAALSHARRHGIARGSLADYLLAAPGGLKGVVQAERQLRKAAEGRAIETREAPREALARKLRKLPTLGLAELASGGSEFALLVARRLPSGEIVLLGEVPEDVALLERAARRLLD